MTLSDIERAAIEAAAKALAEQNDCDWSDSPDEKEFRDAWTRDAIAAIRAYERALCRPIEEAPKDGTPILARHLKYGWLSVQCVTEGGNDWIKTTAALCEYPLCFTTESFDFFVPLPKPEGV